jgi:arsenate reductase
MAEPAGGHGEEARESPACPTHEQGGEAGDQLGTPLVLILCTGNSCRSHIAEGLLRRSAQGKFRVASAGSIPVGYVHPLAIRVMQEVGVDLSQHRSKHLNEFVASKGDVETVITVCGKANQCCPSFPGQQRRHHWPFDDPAHAPGDTEEQLIYFRRVRDEIARVFEAYACGRIDQMLSVAAPAALPEAGRV